MARTTATLRWGLLLEEYPGATYEAVIADATEVGVPSDFAGNFRVCKVTITFPDDADRSPEVGWHEVATTATSPQAWSTVTWSALDRALSNAGYPPEPDELQFLARWRFRRAEVELLQAEAVAALTTERTARTTPTERDEPLDPAVVRPSGEPADEELVDQVHAEAEALDVAQRSRFNAFLTVATIDLAAMTEAEANMALKAIRNIVSTSGA